MHLSKSASGCLALVWTASCTVFSKIFKKDPDGIILNLRDDLDRCAAGGPVTARSGAGLFIAELNSLLIELMEKGDEKPVQRKEK